MEKEIQIRKQLKLTDVSLAVSTALTQLGVTSGELSHAKAVTIYGSWFASAVRTGKLSPVRVGEGKKGKKWYSVLDILALKAVELERAEVILHK